MDKIAAVIGGTGLTGKHVVKKLIEKGIPVRLLSRNIAKAQKMFGSKVQIVEGDLIGPEDLKKLVDGVSYIFTAHGADNYPGENGYELIDFGGTKKLLQSIPKDQRPHIIYMSSIYVERKNPPADPEGRPIYWKGRAEQLVINSPNPYTIVRPSWLNNQKGRKLKINAEQGDQGDGKITREDVAEVMVQALNVKSAKGKIFEIYNVPGDPENDWESFFLRLKLM